MKTKFMNNGSRTIISVLESFCISNGCEPCYTPSDMVVLEELLMSYSAPAIKIMLQSKIKARRKCTDESVKLSYWLNIMKTMLKSNISAKRTNPPMISWLPMSADISEESYGLIVDEYLIADYGFDTMVLIQKIINSYRPVEIERAISSAKSNGVYEVSYINAILEKESAMKELEDKSMERLKERTARSESLLNPKENNHNIMDMAVMQYNWRVALENAELESKMERVTK